MTAFHIKIIAILTMIIDHLGMFFFPDIFFLRIIGRLSFPLFAWLIANGAYHTKNRQQYLMRLVLFAFVSQIPFSLATQLIDPTSTLLNIFFTLSIGLIGIIFLKKTQRRYWLLISFLCALLAGLLNTDYGAFGVLSIIAFYVFFHHRKYLIISQISIFFLMSLQGWFLGNVVGVFEVIGLISLFFILLYNNKEGSRMKYLFYVFYPLQYVFVYFVKLFW